MTETPLRFTTPDGSYAVENIAGVYYGRRANGTVEQFDSYDEAESWFNDALKCARNNGLHPVLDISTEEQHSRNVEVECKTPDEPTRTLPTTPATAPEEEKPKASPEVLENPHYAAQRVQPIDLIETLGSSEFVGFLRGNIIKYTARAGKKSGEPAKKEARKALWYALRWYIEVGGSRDDVAAVLNEMEW